MRKDRNLTLKEIAKKAGCSPSYLSMVENGKVDPGISRLKRIVDGLTDQLMEGDSFYFSSTSNHRFSNPGKEDTVVVWVNTPPQLVNPIGCLRTKDGEKNKEDRN